jgi:ankyrin repeat protein
VTFDEVDHVIKRGDVVSLRQALDDGLDSDLANQYGWTILMSAALSGNSVIGRLLIEYGAKLDSRNQGRDTALSLAIHCAHPTFVQLLLDKGASLDCHPHGNSFEIFLDWVAQYSRNTPTTMKHIREIIDRARTTRAQANSI